MRKFFKLFILLNAIAISAFAVCPEYPTIPTTTPRLITRASEGLSNFPSSTKQLSISFTFTFGEECAAGTYHYLFSMGLMPPGGGALEYTVVYMECDQRYLIVGGDGGAVTIFTKPYFPSSSGFSPLSLFMSFDLDSNDMRIEIQSDSAWDASRTGFTMYSGISFDENSKFYLCADKDGASSNACTVSELMFEYRYYGDSGWPTGHLGGINPELAAFYPLVDGPATSLASSISSASSGYFGDSESNPKDGTTPTWDSSNSFVIISTGEFLTFPFPALSAGSLVTSQSFSFAAWVKITDIPAASTTLFSMHSADGTQVGFRMMVSQSRAVSVEWSPFSITANGMTPFVTLNEWQLIGFTAYFPTEKQTTTGTIFVGTSWGTFFSLYQGIEMDLSAVSVIRIGGASDSISGQISAVRIMTPGGGFIKSTELCSSDNSIELGVGSFPLACSEGNSLNPADNKCVAACPSGTAPTSNTAVSLCAPCFKRTYYDGSACQACSDHCAECDADGCKTCDDGYQLNTAKECVLKDSTTITKEKYRLSGGAIAGIACGCIVILLFILVLGGRYYKKKEATKRVSTIKFGNPKTSPDDIKATPISPMTSEANPLMP